MLIVILFFTTQLDPNFDAIQANCSQILDEPSFVLTGFMPANIAGFPSSSQS